MIQNYFNIYQFQMTKQGIFGKNTKKKDKNGYE